MKKIKKLFSILGPGFITGASDDDPAGIATYSQTGAIFGFAQAWLAIFSFPLMASIQEMCGRIGLVTGKGLAGVIRKHYSKNLLYGAVSLLFIANTINIGADLGAMAASAQLLFDIPFPVLLIVMVVLTLVLEIFVSYRTYSIYLKYLAVALFSYIFAAFAVNIDWKQVVISTLVPHFELTQPYLLNIVAVLGTTISPYLFFWQANEEVEEEISQHKLSNSSLEVPKVTSRDIRKLRVDTILGMMFSNLIMFFIIVTTGATLFQNGAGEIATAKDAALALKPFAGEAAFILFSLGIIGTGLLALPVLAGSASYAISEAFGWRAGLYQKLKKAHGFYGAITIATLVGLLINFININPIAALYWSAIINGIIAPPLIVMIIIIANNKEIMGHRTNSPILNILGILTAIIMSSAALALGVSYFIK